jgi:hypothetical protein
VGCVACATTIGDPAEIWRSALFSAAAQAPLIAMAQAKPMAKIVIFRFMITSLIMNLIISSLPYRFTAEHATELEFARIDAPADFSAASY